MAGVNVRTFDNLPTSINIQDVEVYCNGKYKMSGSDFVSRLIKGLGVRKVTQPSTVYSGTREVNVSIDIFVGEDWEVFRNGVEQSDYEYDVSLGKIVKIRFPVGMELNGDEVKIVKREIYSKI